MRVFNSNELEILATTMLNDEKVFNVEGFADYVIDTPLIKHEIETQQKENNVAGVTNYKDKTFSMYATVEKVLIYTYTPINILKEQMQDFIVPAARYNNALKWYVGAKHSLKNDLQSKMRCLQTLKDYTDGKIIARDIISSEDVSSDNPMYIKPLDRDMSRDTYNAYMNLSLKKIPKCNAYTPYLDNSIDTNNQKSFDFVVSDCFEMKPQWNMYIYKNDYIPMAIRLERMAKEYKERQVIKDSKKSDKRKAQNAMRKLRKRALKGYFKWFVA